MHSLLHDTNSTHTLRGALRTLCMLGVVTLAPLPLLAQQSSKKEAAEQLWVEHNQRTPTKAIKSSSFAELAEDVSPSVVNIIVTVSLSGELPGELESPGDSGATAVGSGFIIHPDGYILTNNHVVENATAIRIRLDDQREFDARVVGTDPRTDVALVKVDEEVDFRFKAIALGNSDSIKVGENVLAIGNPLGLNHTVTSGIISALGRKDLAPGGKILESDFIQTDASINPGNSGGPLISIHGEVIGINTLVNTQGQGIGFAIPINIVKALLPQLKDTGYVIRTWLGVRVQSLTPALARSFSLDQSFGALISEVVTDSPASRAGLIDGDIILSFDGTSIKYSDQLNWLIATGGTDRDIPIEILREGKRQGLTLNLEAIPGQKPPKIPTQKKRVLSESSSAPLNTGIQVKLLDESLARKVGARKVQGVAITSLEDDAPIKEAGLRKRDVIVQIDTTDINSTNDFDAALLQATSKSVIRFKVVRSGKQIYLADEPR